MSENREMQKSIWRSAIATVAMLVGLNVSPLSAAIIDLSDFDLRVAPGPVFNFQQSIVVNEDAHHNLLGSSSSASHITVYKMVSLFGSQVTLT